MTTPFDVLLFGQSDTEGFRALMQWTHDTPDLHRFTPDYHRLQIEYWVWLHREQLTGLVVDVGVQNARRWIGPGYVTFGETGCDVAGDVCALPYADGSVDAFVVTEVLEHCADPFAAVRELYRALKPGGLLLVTSPFIWPWHGTDEYKDYWRFTDDGWRLLLKDFRSLHQTACRLTNEGDAAYDLLRRWECMGHRAFTHATTGFLCEAVK